MNIIFFIPYYNNSHFIELQIRSFRKYLKKCNWKVCIIDDSNNDTLNVLSNTKENIFNECLKYPSEIIYHKFDQNIHQSSNATDKHCTILNYIVQKLSAKYNDEYDYMCLFDADMCFIEEFDANLELENYDIIGPKRIQWLSNVQLSNAPIFDYIFVHNCFFNLKTITNLNTMNLSRIPSTTCDTGSMIVEFFYNNPNYKIKFMNFSAGAERISEFYNFEFFWNKKIIHFLTSTMWDNQQYNTNRYPYTYTEKLNKMSEIVDRGLNDTEKEIINKTYETLWIPNSRNFIGTKAIKNDFIHYNLNLK
jgi:hypothetical protein